MKRSLSVVLLCLLSVGCTSRDPLAETPHPTQQQCQAQEREVRREAAMGVPAELSRNRISVDCAVRAR